MSIEKYADAFTATETFNSSTPFSAADLSAKMKVSKKTAQAVVRLMSNSGLCKKTTPDSHGGFRYVKAVLGSKVIAMKWRNQNVGEIIYYKGMHHFGNADAGWRGAL